MLYKYLSFVYKMMYYFQPIELLKKLMKVLGVSLAIIKNQTTVYPAFVKKFEDVFSKYSGCEYGLTFCNGTSSIEAALFALEIGIGDEVLVPSATFHASIDPIVNSGARPIYVDVDPNTFTVCPKDLKRKISDKTKCILVVHLWGNVADMTNVKKICDDNNLYIIEDASHAHGAKWNGTSVGSIGNIGCFSLQGSKPISAGEGGIAITNNKTLFYRMSMFGHFGRHAHLFQGKNNNLNQTGFGYKKRANPLGIKMALVDLFFNDYLNKIKFRNMKKMESIIDEINGVTYLKHYNGSTIGGCFGGFPILIESHYNIELLISSVRKYGVGISRYPFLMHHKLPGMGSIGSRKNIIYNNEFEHSEVDITLPFTDSTSQRLLLLDARYLSFFPFFIRFILKRTLMFELNIKNNAEN
jgi:dTDP-4-amino-4,6-dideoxygalactose transaminase